MRPAFGLFPSPFHASTTHQVLAQWQNLLSRQDAQQPNERNEWRRRRANLQQALDHAHQEPRTQRDKVDLHGSTLVGVEHGLGVGNA